MFKFFKQAICEHEFQPKDIVISQGPAIPTDGGYREWEQYFVAHYKWAPTRVTWPCRKCGKVFMGNCGLNILEHGTYVENSK